MASVGYIIAILHYGMLTVYTQGAYIRQYDCVLASTCILCMYITRRVHWIPITCSQLNPSSL